MPRLEAQTGTGLRLRRGETLLIVDPQGGQVSDVFCLNAADHRETLSSGRTIDYGGTLSPSVGDALYSNRSRPMLRILEDTCGHHDISLTPCSQETFDLLYPELGGAAHPGCFENLCAALAAYGVAAEQIGTTFNVFMNVWYGRDGELHIDPPRSVARDHLTLRAEMELVVGLTACSAEKSNGGICKPIDYHVGGLSP